MSTTNQKNGVSAFDLEPNPFEQSFASTKEQQSEGSSAPPSQAYLPQDSQHFQQRPESRPPVNVGRGADGKSPFLYGSQKPNILSPPLLTRGGFRRLPPLLLSPSCVPSQNSGANNNTNNNNHPHNHNHNNNNNNNNNNGVGVGPVSASQTSGIAVNNSNHTSSTSTGGGANNGSVSIKAEPSRTPSFFLNLSKTGLTPNESSLRTGLTPGILAPGQQHHHYPALPALNGANQVHPQAKPGSVVSGGVTPAPFTPCLGSLLGFPGTASPGHVGRPPLNLEGSYAAAAEPTMDQDNSAHLAREPNNGQHLQHHLQQHQHPPPIAQQHHQQQLRNPQQLQQQQQQQQQQHLKRSPPQPDSPQAQQQPLSTGRKRNTSNASKSSKAAKKSQSSTPNLAETRRLSKNEDIRPTMDESGDMNEEDQERKRKEFLERNRVAASKFRKRKKEYIKRVEMDLQFYQNEYEDMGRALDKLCGIIPGSPTPAASSSLISLLENSISHNDVPSSLSLLAHMKQVVYETRYFQRNGRNPRREMESNHMHDTDDEDRHRTDNDSIGNVRSMNGSTTDPTELNRMKRSSSINYPGSVPANFTNTGLQSQHQSQQQLQQPRQEQPPHTAPITTGSLPNFPPESGSFQGMIKNETTAPSMLPVSLIDARQSRSEQEVANTIGTIGSLPDVISSRPAAHINDVHAQGPSHADNMSDLKHNSLVDLANQSIRAEPMLPKYPNTE
ncbi:hypothetical protein ZYGR_0Z02030 [Zygosaccharomyces rouxii]|uniref:BZIP domain-containing protein n=1 Tax=Zygosaccharomyces rouxii TaxID=4956 RepID=A0A1Q3A5C9_ZYGRO|nr:hypothetical protein ZYGR_0Z02030 [Zygosaccharomyces rouxii]